MKSFCHFSSVIFDLFELNREHTSPNYCSRTQVLKSRDLNCIDFRKVIVLFYYTKHMFPLEIIVKTNKKCNALNSIHIEGAREGAYIIELIKRLVS